MYDYDPSQPLLPPRETVAQHNCTWHLGNAISCEEVTKSSSYLLWVLPGQTMTLIEVSFVRAQACSRSAHVSWVH